MVEDEGAVEEFGSAGADPAFDDRVGPSRRMHPMEPVSNELCG
ncbi:hypothetical protein [Kibdelosporangium philippinense]